MKKQFRYFTFVCILSTGMLMSCKEQTGTDVVATPADGEQLTTDIVENQTAITFERDLHDFGDIIQGEKVTTEFKFVNTGQHPLLISDAYGSCGCTVPQWPKEPIAPGSSGVIKVVFDSKNKSGQFKKNVTVVANTVPSNTKIMISGNIIKPVN